MYLAGVKVGLQRDGQDIPTPEEVDVFRLFKLPWVEPWAREV